MKIPWLSPRNPYTGNGYTKRDVYDTPRVTFRTSGGKRIKETVKPVKPRKKGK